MLVCVCVCVWVTVYEVPTYLASVSRRSQCVSQVIRCHAPFAMTPVHAKNNNHTVAIMPAEVYII